jgi:hypothetical protein
MDVLAEGALQELVQGSNEFVQIDVLRSGHVFAGEGQELAHQASRALGRVHDLGHVVALRVVLLEILRDEACVVLDDGQQVVEVVRDASSEAADRFHLL